MTQPLDRTLLNQHVHRYRKQMTQQHKQAVALLTQEAPDYSSAAAACHRALQFQRQAGALTALLAEHPEQPAAPAVVVLDPDPAARADAVQRVARAMWQAVLPGTPWSAQKYHLLEMATAAITELEQSPAKLP